MKIICYGDSNTYGYDPSVTFGGRYDAAWVDILAKKTGWNIHNEGENGREIPKEAVFFPEDTDLLIIMLGTNDLLQFCPPEEVCKRMERFIISLNLEREKILLISPPRMTLGEWVWDHKLINNSSILAKHYQILAQQLGIHFLDSGEWSVPLTFDGVHFTEDGHRIFAEGIHNQLSKEA